MPNIIDILIRARDETGGALRRIGDDSSHAQQSLVHMGDIGVMALAGLGAASVKMAANYDLLVTRLVTSANESDKNMKMVSDGMLDLTTKVGMTGEELAKGMYTVESAGYHGAEGLIVLKAAAQGAKDEGADLGKVANAVTDILTDYHLSASHAADVTSQMVKAVSYGKTTFEQFSSSMANILPIAASVHLSFADVAGVLATMTAHGMTAQRASMNEAQAIRSLIAPTNKMTDEFRALGITSDQVHKKLGTVGLGGTLQWLSDVAKAGAPKIGQSYTEALKKLMGTAPGLAVALMTTGENAQSTADAIKGIGAASADASGNVEGFALIQKTFAFQMDQFKATITTLAIKLGHELIPILQSMAVFVSQHTTLFTRLAMVVGGLVVTLSAFSIVVRTIQMLTAIWTVAQLALNSAFLASPITWIVIGILALAAGFVYLWNRFEGFRKFWQAAWKDIQKVASAAWDALRPAATAIWTFLSGIFNHIVEMAKGTITSIQTWWKSHGAELIQVVRTTWTIIQSLFQSAWMIIGPIVKVGISQTLSFLRVGFNLILSIVRLTWATITGIIRVAWSAITTITKTVWNAIVAIFNVFLDVVTGHWRRAWNDIRAFFSQTWGNIIAFLHTVWSSLANIFARMVDTIRAVWNAVYEAIVGPVRSAYRTVTGIVGSIRDAVSNAVSGSSIVGNFGILGTIGMYGFGHAHGGIVGAATGGPRGGLVMVGEHGRELVRLPMGSRVHSNPDTERMLGGAQGGAGSVSGVVVEYTGDPVVMSFIRRLVRVYGRGDVQRAFGS